MKKDLVVAWAITALVLWMVIFEIVQGPDEQEIFERVWTWIDEPGQSPVRKVATSGGDRILIVNVGNREEVFCYSYLQSDTLQGGVISLSHEPWEVPAGDDAKNKVLEVLKDFVK